MQNKKKYLQGKTTEDEANLLVADFDWDDVQAQIQADEDLAQRMLEEERESLSIVERARLLAELIDKRKCVQAALQYEVSEIIPRTMSQQEDIEAMSLVKKDSDSTDSYDDKERTLWVDLKSLATWDERLEIVEVKVSSFVGISKRSPGSSISMSLTCCFNSLISPDISVIFEGSSFSLVGKQLAKSCEAKSLYSSGFKEVTRSLVSWLMSGYEGLAFIEATLVLAFAFDYSNSTF
ncbi:hypothetical protein Tco_1548039 [Tanacetum coccineum]